MQKNDILIFAIILSTLTSCKKGSDQQESTYKITQSLNIPINFDNAPAFSGSFYSYKDSCDYIFIAEPKTRKNITTYNINGDVVDCIDLNPAFSIVDRIGSISIIGIDTIVISSLYNNKIAIIDKNGNVWKTINIDTLLPDSLIYYYSFYPSFLSASMTDSNLIYLNSRPNSNKILNKYKIPIESTGKNIKNYHKLLYDEPYLIQITNFLSETPKILFGLNDLYHNICSNEYFINDNPKFKLVNENLYVISVFSNHLFLIDEVTLSIKKEIKISSKYTPIGHKPLKVDVVNIDAQINESLSLKQTEGAIINILYDLQQKEYLIIVKHKDWAFCPKYFSVIILDSSYNKIQEHIMDEDIYNPYSAILLKSGLMFSVKNKNNKNEFKKFDIISFN